VIASLTRDWLLMTAVLNIMVASTVVVLGNMKTTKHMRFFYILIWATSHGAERYRGSIPREI